MKNEKKILIVKAKKSDCVAAQVLNRNGFETIRGVHFDFYKKDDEVYRFSHPIWIISGLGVRLEKANIKDFPKNLLI